MMSGRVWQQVDLLLLGRLLVAFALVQNLFWLADDLQHAPETARREWRESPRPRGDADGDGGITWQNW